MEMDISHFYMVIGQSPFPYGESMFPYGDPMKQFPYGNGDSPFPYGDLSIPISIWEIPISIWGTFHPDPHMETGIPHFHVGICASQFPYGDSHFHTPYGDC